MVIAILFLIALILLFGAGVVKGWLANALGVIFGIGLLTFALFLLTKLFGEDAFWTIWVVGGGIFIAVGLWAQSYNPEEAERNRLRKSEQKRFRQEEKRVAREVKRRSKLSPIQSLMEVFGEYDTRTTPDTKAKAEALFDAGDEEALRELVDGICERNLYHLEFDGKLYSSRGHYEGGRF